MAEEMNQIEEAQSLKYFGDSLFLLKKSSSSSTISIEVDFSPTHFSSSASISSPLRTMPTFHNDSNHFTPSFILEVDEERYAQNLEVYRNLHNRKMLQISEQKCELFVPKPSKNNSFCCVCKTPFQHYLQHLNQPKHRYLLKKSEYYSKVHQLCSLFSKKKPKIAENSSVKKRRARAAKTKPIVKQETYLSKSFSSKETCVEQSI